MTDWTWVAALVGPVTFICNLMLFWMIEDSFTRWKSIVDQVETILDRVYSGVVEDDHE